MPLHARAATRRWQATLIVTVFVVAVAGAALTGWWYALESTPHQGPIVLISIDGFRPAQLPANGSDDAGMPSIEALAANAVVFERAYTHSPLTLPATASILAGQLPFEHGVRDEAGFALKADVRSLAELLRNRGFETGAAVSSFVLRPESGVAQGFSFFDTAISDDLDAGELRAGAARDGAHTADAAAQWLRAQRGHRFFLFVQVSEAAAESTVRQLVTELQESALYERATIVLTADRGDAGTGVSLDDASLHVPLLIKQPGGEGAGRRVAVPVQHIDILPTLLDLVRAPIPPGLRGRSLRAVLAGGGGRVAEQPIYAESLAGHFRFGGPGKFALASPGHRYVRGGREELIDLERGNVTSPAPEAPEAVRLRTELDRLLEGRPVDPPVEISPADEDEYAALGYLSGGSLVGSEPAPMDADEEAWVVEAHRSAAILAGEKKYAAAIGQLREIARAHPRMAVVQYQLGMLLGRTGRLKEANTAFRAAATLEPDNPYIPVALAGVLLRAGRHENARDRAALAVALAERQDPRARAAAHEVATRVALALGDAEGADAHAAAAEREDPALPMPQFVRGRLLYTEGRYEEALAAFEEAAASLEPHGRDLEELHLYLGDTLARLNRYPEAEQQFREELRAFPRNSRAYGSLAVLYHASRRASGVEEILDALIEATQTPEGYETAARLWMIVGEPSRAAALRADARTRFRGGPSLALIARDGRR